MVIDFHAHILPGADHGSDSLERSLRQLKRAAAAGIETVVATPHFYPDRQELDAFIAMRDAAYDLLRATADSVRIVKAAEVAVVPGLAKQDGLARLCVGETDLILLELPGGAWSDWIFDAVFEIKARHRLNPVIAHIDRYPQNQAERLVALDLLLQVNAEGLVSFGKRRYLKRLLKEGKAHVLGSDAHGEADEYRKYAYIRRNMAELFDLMMVNAERLLGCETI